MFSHLWVLMRAAGGDNFVTKKDMDKTEYRFDSVVAETLLIPLYFRAKESRRGRHALLRDETAERLVAGIDYDYSKFDKAGMSAIGCVVRSNYFDEAVRRFIATHQRPVVVNVGCGLDTRRQRTDGGRRAVCYELDLPEVISLRRTLLPDTPGDTCIPASLTDTAWMDRLRTAHPDGDFIFVAEGVLMYFYERQVKAFLHAIASRFGGGQVWLDVCGRTMLKAGVKPDSLRQSGAQIRSGITDGHEVERWEPRLRLIEQAIYQRMHTRRWSLPMRLLALMPGVSKGFSSLLGYEIMR